MVEHISSTAVPVSTSPVAQCTRAGGWVFIGGQMPVDPAAGNIPPEPRTQVDLTIAHCINLLAAAGGKPADVTLAIVYVTDLNVKPLVNEAFMRVFGPMGPARNLVAVSEIGSGAVVEISLIACVGSILRN